VSDKRNSKRTIKTKAEWSEHHAEELSRLGQARTGSGTPVEPLYGPEKERPEDYLNYVGFPGEPPYTRGIYPTMYRGRPWTMRQYAGFGTASESNRRYRYLLEQGQTGLSVAFDLPTQLGLDADHDAAKGEVGQVGVSICTLEDMETLLRDIPLERVSTSMTINATAAVVLAMYLAVAERKGVPLTKLSGTVQNDVLKEYVARGNYIYPPRPSMRLAVDIMAFCKEHVPSWNTISISGYHIREAGSTAVQELAFTFANAIAYVEEAVSRGLSIDDFGPRLSFFFNSHSDFLEEVAKFRAARYLWHWIVTERFAAANPAASRLRFHTQTAGCTLTAQQPLNNLVRVGLQAMAAVLGGTQSLHTNSYDEALSLPSEEAATAALRTQQIIAEESGATSTIDPLAGSYYVEHLTRSIIADVKKYLETIDSMGGALEAIENGYVQREIHKSAYAFQRELEAGARRVVGVNKYSSGGIPEPVFRLRPEVETEQVERVKRHKLNRDSKASQEALRSLEAAARGESNLVPLLLKAVEAGATLGETSDVMRRVFGTYDSMRTPGM
jgi:methylmalonyl-CoA mutase N-terminal domain/subunit